MQATPHHASGFSRGTKESFEFSPGTTSIWILKYIKTRLEIERKGKHHCPVEIGHAAYTEFLKYFALYKHHRDNLEKRGLSPEDMEKKDYKSIIRDGKAQKVYLRDLLRKGYLLPEHSWVLCGRERGMDI